MDVRLRDLREEDSEPLFALEADPRVAHMAAFGAPKTRETWPAHWALITTVPENRTWIVEVDGAFAGMACCYPLDGALQIGYSVLPALWGRGIATEAVRLLLAGVAERPLEARVAEDNRRRGACSRRRGSGSPVATRGSRPSAATTSPSWCSSCADRACRNQRREPGFDRLNRRRRGRGVRRSRAAPP